MSRSTLSHSHSPVIVISRSAIAKAKRTAFEDKLAAGLQEAGIAAVLAPDLSLLRSGTKALEFLRTVEGPLVFLSWLQPRAAFWQLAFLGVDGRMAATLAKAKAGRTGERPILPLHLGAFDTPGRWVEHLRKITRGDVSLEGEAPRRLPVPRKERWYPVVDHSRCVNCLQCFEFCIFGVYARDAQGRLFVKRPDACKPGCPACSRICPRQAIMFPLYSDDPGIAGADGATIQPVDAAQVRQLREGYRAGKVSSGEVARAGRAMAGKGTPADPPAVEPTAADSAEEPRDYFDDWIERLGRE